MDTQILKQMYSLKKQERSPIKAVWDLIEQYVVPFRANFYIEGGSSEASLNWRRRKIYDSTAVYANQALGSHLQSVMANSSYRWFDLMFRNKRLRADREAKEWLSNASETTFMYLQQSNFDLTSNEAFLDIPSFGTAIATQEFHDTNGTLDKVMFSSVPLDQGFYELDFEDMPNYFWRRLNWTANKFVSKFGAENLPRVVAEDHKKKKNDQTFELVYSIYPREQYRNADVRKKLSVETRPFGTKYFMADTGEQVGEEGGYYEMPVYVPMWRRTSGSSFGHSPAMVVLSDILTLNELVEMILKANEKAIDPPIVTTRKGVFGDIDLTAGGVTVAASKDSIWPLDTNARFDVGELTKERLQESIKQAFFADQLQLKESPEMTAAEVYTRFELMARLIGPSAGRIQHGYHAPIVTTTFNGLYRHGVFPEPPDSVGDSDIDVEFIGPMARAQKLDKANNIERYTQGIGALVEIFPDITDNIDSDGVATELATYLTVPTTILQTEGKRRSIRNARKKQQEEMMELEKAKLMSESAKNVTPLLQEGGGNGGLGAVQGGQHNQ